MKLKNIFRFARKARFGGPLGALASAVVAGIGWEVGASIYRAVAGKKPAPKPEATQEE